MQICGKTFSNASALTKHKLTHSDERKHTCTVCGKAFKRQDHLNGHMLTHRSKKPFECSGNGCGKSYCDARSLRRHIESRHGAEALSTMIIAPTPHSDTDFIIIPNSSATNSKSGKNNKRSKNSNKKKAPKLTPTPSCSSSSNSSNSASNPLLCQGSNSSPEDNSAEENELLTSVENLLNLEDSSTSGENAVALLDASLMEMGVIQEEIEEEMEMDMEDVSSPSIMLSSVNVDDKLNNNETKSSVEDLCCGNGSVHSTKKSQLHHLLTTQRAIGKGVSVVAESDSDDMDVAAVTLIKESLIASCTANTSANNVTIASPPQFQLHMNPEQGWSSESSAESGHCEVIKFCFIYQENCNAYVTIILKLVMALWASSRSY